MLSDERKAEITRRLDEIAAARRVLSVQDAQLENEKSALAREYVTEEILPSTTWSVSPDGTSMVADERLGIEVLKLFGAGFYHESFDLTGPLASDPDRPFMDLLSWLKDERHLAGGDFAEPAELLTAFKLARTCYTTEAFLDGGYSVYARVDDSRLALWCTDTDVLLAFVEKHKLKVRWEDAERAVQEAEEAAKEAVARAETTRERLAKFRKKP